MVTGAGQQRSKVELTADIRARRRTALVVNVRSRRGRRHYPTVCRQLPHAGLDLLALHPVANPRHLPQALAAAVDSGADLIVLGGGDGTLRNQFRTRWRKASVSDAISPRWVSRAKWPASRRWSSASDTSRR